MKKLFLLLAAMWLSPANAQQFGSWYVGSTPTGEYAATVNESGGVFGKYCYREAGSCLWLLTGNVSCEEGAQYPVLANSSAGAHYTTVICRPLDGKGRYVVTDEDLMARLISKGGQIGFAFPMESGAFRVFRFDVAQNYSAMAALDAKFSRPAPRVPARPTTRETTL